MIFFDIGDLKWPYNNNLLHILWLTGKFAIVWYIYEECLVVSADFWPFLTIIWPFTTPVTSNDLWLITYFAYLESAWKMLSFDMHIMWHYSTKNAYHCFGDFLTLESIGWLITHDWMTQTSKFIHHWIRLVICNRMMGILCDVHKFEAFYGICSKNRTFAITLEWKKFLT